MAINSNTIENVTAFNQTQAIIDTLTAATADGGFGLNAHEANNDTAKKGCCLSICFTWMKRKMTQSKEGPVDRLNHVKSKIRAAILRQKMQQELWSVGGGENNYTCPASFIGVKLNVDELNTNFQLINLGSNLALHNKLKGIKKTCLLMDYRWADDSGHAVAWYVSSGKALNINQHIYFFDPNYGEFKVKFKNGHTFISDYFVCIGVDFGANANRYKTVTVSKRPPDR